MIGGKMNDENLGVESKIIIVRFIRFGNTSIWVRRMGVNSVRSSETALSEGDARGIQFTLVTLLCILVATIPLLFGEGLRSFAFADKTLIR